jgi:hypothetical protein
MTLESDFQAFGGSDLKQRVLAATRKEPPGGGSWDLLGLARLTDAKVSDLEGAIAALRAENYDLDIRDGVVQRAHVAPSGAESHFWRLQEGGWVRFGVLGDNQLGNRHQRLDVSHTAYEHYRAEGIDTVYHTGNLVDGYDARLNGFELLPEAGTSMESQAAYAASVYPKAEGITTHFITGECHEGWWAKKMGINVGRFLEDRFRQAGRDDLRYVGHLEADIEIRHERLAEGTRGPIIKLTHPGGGTAYALSYKAQKIAESFQGGEKPQAVFIGHFHKYDVCFPREVVCVQTGCQCDQTIFMRKIPTAAHVGYLIVEMYVGSNGVIERFRHEWKPFYDKGYYQKYETW